MTSPLNHPMIDWISVTIPFSHSSPIDDGFIMGTKRDGTVEFKSLRRLKFKGSYETGIQIRTDRSSLGYFGVHHALEVSGNLVKLFQGHNIWGTGDLRGLLFELYCSLQQRPEVELPYSNLKEIVEGNYKLTRVDITNSYLLKNIGQVRAWIKGAERSCRMSHRGRGQFTGDTLYFGKNSEYWSMKMYSKGDEVRAHQKHQPSILGNESATLFADNLLRVECVLRSKELKRRGLQWGSGWDKNTAKVLHQSLLGNLEMTDNFKLAPEILEDLPGRLRGVYALWEEGSDVRQHFSRPTYYRYRNELLKHGIDIAVRQDKKPESNVVPLVRILEAIPASIPEWALGSPLYFQPRSPSMIVAI